MRFLINYLRQCFCRHDWYIEEGRVNHSQDHGGGSACKVYMRCKICGYHKKHWKFI